MKNSSFSYVVTLKNEQGIDFEILGIFPSFEEISFKSKVFESYVESVKSCKALIEDLAANINGATGENLFKVGAEVNSKLTGSKNFSGDWQELEVARFWVYNQEMEGTGDIAAVCRASLFSEPIVLPSLLN